MEFINDWNLLRIRLQPIHGFCRGILTVSGPAIEPPCHRSHMFQTHFSLSLFQTEIMAYGEDYQQPALYAKIYAQSRRISKCVVANGLCYQQETHTPLSLQANTTKGRCLNGNRYIVIPSQTSCPSQYILVARRIYDSVQDKLASRLLWETY
jgi:hypothetical protein